MPEPAGTNTVHYARKGEATRRLPLGLSAVYSSEEGNLKEPTNERKKEIVRDNHKLRDILQRAKEAGPS